jgi:serine/threonine protein kinase
MGRTILLFAWSMPAKWNLLGFLRKHLEIDFRQRIRWTRQIVDTLSFVHVVGVIHGDLTLNSILLAENLDAKLVGLAGSSIDDLDLFTACNTSHMYLGGPSLSIRADIFPLGFTFYHIMTGTFPYYDLLETEHEDDITAFFE